MISGRFPIDLCKVGPISTLLVATASVKNAPKIQKKIPVLARPLRPLRAGGPWQLAVASAQADQKKVRVDGQWRGGGGRGTELDDP